MECEKDEWIRIFDITDTSKHQKGFILFRVISMLYPEKCPEAITKLTVWKRYNDFKKLHKEMKRLHDEHKITDNKTFPQLFRGSYFRRYDIQTLRQKQESALAFLEYVGNHPQLFKSKEFVKFFEISYTPVNHLNGNINNIRADLNLPDDPEFCSKNDDEIISDTDSISTLSSFTPHFLETPATSELSGDSTSQLLLKSSEFAASQSSDNVSICTIESLTLLDGQIYSSPPRSPDSDEVYTQYIIDASVHIKIAEDLENSRKFDESFVAYKTAIDILLKNGKDEKDYDKKRLVKYKTEKYLLRAEKLYNMYLAPEVRNLRTIYEHSRENNEIKKPAMSDLYKYNVVRIIESGMLVTHSDTQKLHYVKVIHKTMKFLDENLILPEDIPFMIRLQNYYNCDNALFLVLEYINGVNILEYLKKNKNNDLMPIDMIDKVNCCELSDDESEKSFSEIIKDYANKSKDRDSDGSFEKINKEDIFPDHSKIEKSINNQSRKEIFSNEFDGTNELQYSKIIKWSAQLVLALEKLHILGIICKDLKTRNLLINSDDDDLRLTFMCNAKELCDIFKETHNLNLAPEVHGIEKVGKEADWWSFGAILYEILVGMDLNQVHPHYFSVTTVLKVPKYVRPEGRSLLKQLLVYEPTKRLGSGPHGIENLKSHPFFKAVDWKALIDDWK